jgi:glycosyltransferase involved in cell wall biosynthesis
MVSEHASPLATLGDVDAGGQNVHVAALSLALAGRGHDVRVYTRRDSPTLPRRVRFGPGVDVIHVPAGPARRLPKDDLLPHMAEFGRRLAASWAGAGAPDLVHAHFWMSGLAAVHAARTVGVPVVQTFHALGTVKHRHQGERDSSPRGRINAEIGICRAADMIIATCSDEVTELHRMGATNATVQVVPCGVDTQLFAPGPAAEHAAAPTLLSVGRLVERKGLDTIIRALVKLPGVQLVIAGGPEKGELATHPEAVRLRELAASLGVVDRLRLLGSVPHDRMPALMRAADLVVCTPWYEPFGIVPIEAAACGRAVVGSAVGGLLDTVVPGTTGTLIPPRDPGAVALAVRELLGDSALRHRYETAARRRALTLYDWSSVAAATERAYRSLVGAPVRPGVLAG